MINKITRIVLALSVSLITQISYGQNLIDENLTKFQWITDSTICGLNVGEFKEIGLSKLRIPVDSLKNDCSLWTFTENEIIIRKYSSKNGLETDSVSCPFEYNDGELLIYHYSQDSTVWKYSASIVSTGNYILITRKKML